MTLMTKPTTKTAALSWPRPESYRFARRGSFERKEAGAGGARKGKSTDRSPRDDGKRGPHHDREGAQATPETQTA